MRNLEEESNGSNSKNGSNQLHSRGSWVSGHGVCSSVEGGISVGSGWAGNISGSEKVVSRVILSKGRINSDNVINNSISINISNVSSNNLSAVSRDANEISSDELSKVSNKDSGISNSDGLHDPGGEGDWSEGDTVGLVVLSGLDNISNNDKSVSDSIVLGVGVVGSNDVSSNSSLSSDGSSRSKNVVDDSFNDSREGLTLDDNVSSSSDVNDPSGRESASLELNPVDGAEGSSIDLNVVEIVDLRAGDQESIGVLNRGLGISGKSSESGLNVSIVGLGSIEGTESISRTEVVLVEGLNVSWGSEDSSNIGKCLRSRVVKVSSVWVDLSVSERSISSNKEGIGSPRVSGESQFLSKSKSVNAEAVSCGQSSFNISSIAGVSIERNDIEVSP